MMTIETQEYTESDITEEPGQLEIKSTALDQANQIQNTGKWATDDTSFLDPIQLKNLFNSEEWVYIVCDLIAMKISSQPLRVMKQVMNDGVANVEPAEDHPLQATLERPNEYQDYHSWMYVHVVDLTLIGNGVQWKLKNQQENKLQIFNVPVESVQIDFDQDGRIRRYATYEIVDREGYPVQRLQWSFNPQDIIHVRRPNPSSMIWGLSPFIPGQRPLLFNRWSQEYLNNFYQKGATPGLALMQENTASTEQLGRMLKSFEGAYTGRRNQRRTLVLPKGVSVKELTHSLSDQQLKDYISQNRETILALLKVPPHEVGLQKQGSLGSEEYKTALKNFWSSTLIPTQRLISGTMTHAFQDMLGKDHFLEFDNSDVDILQEDKKAKADLATVMLNTRTLNEVREAVWQDPPLEGGDKLPGSQAPALDPFATFSKPVAPEEDKPMESKEVPIGNSDLDLAGLKAQQEVGDTWVKANGNWFNQREAEVRKQTGKSEPSVYKLAIETFGNQILDVIPAVKKWMSDEKNYRQAKSYIKSDGAGRRRSWSVKAKIEDEEKLKKEIEKALEKTRAEWRKGYTDSLSATIDTGYKAGIDVPFDVEDREALQALQERNKKQRRLILQARGLDTFAKMNETTTESIMRIIDNGVKRNFSIGEIARSIADDFTNIDKINSRANTIARTEVLTAVSLGQAAAMKDAKELIPNLQKMWITAQDDRVRGLKTSDQKDHINMHGQTRAVDEPFTEPKTGEEIDYPRAPGATPAMAINCRCTWVMLPGPKMEDVNADNATSNQIKE